MFIHTPVYTLHSVTYVLYSHTNTLFADNEPDIPVRLVGGSVSTEGRVEVFYRGEWGTICDDNWDINEAQVVCRQLGYDIAFAAYSEAKFGEGSGTIWMDELQCNGNEQNILEDCRFNGWGRNDCDHSEDAGVLCLGKNI